MFDANKKVKSFHDKFGVLTRKLPHLPEEATPCLPTIKYEIVVEGRTERQLRVDLLIEEVEEYMQAESDNDLTGIADALGDIIYIAVGTAQAYGIPIAEIFDEIHCSNMSKTPATHAGGKVSKGPNYFPPNIDKILEEARLVAEAEDKQLKFDL